MDESDAATQPTLYKSTARSMRWFHELLDLCSLKALSGVVRYYYI